MAPVPPTHKNGNAAELHTSTGAINLATTPSPRHHQGSGHKQGALSNLCTPAHLPEQCRTPAWKHFACAQRVACTAAAAAANLIHSKTMMLVAPQEGMSETHSTAHQPQSHYTGIKRYEAKHETTDALRMPHAKLNTTTPLHLHMRTKAAKTSQFLPTTPLHPMLMPTIQV